MLHLPADAVVPILGEVRAYGATRMETGGFLLAPIDDPTRITTVAFAGTVGITRRYGLFGISGLALDRLFTWADDSTCHSGAVPLAWGARLSLPDRPCARLERPRLHHVCHPVLPRPPRDPSRWGWWKFDGSMWKTETPPKIDADAQAATFTFDEDGVA